MECSEWLERFENNANQPPQILVFVFFGILVILADIRAGFGKGMVMVPRVVPTSGTTPKKYFFEISN